MIAGRTTIGSTKKLQSVLTRLHKGYNWYIGVTIAYNRGTKGTGTEEEVGYNTRVPVGCNGGYIQVQSKSNNYCM
jgi:hypothetical protein